MKRTATVLMLLSMLGGCMSTQNNSSKSASGWGGFGGGSQGAGPGGPPSVPGLQGPYGQPVAMSWPYSNSPPGAMAAQAMMARSVPLDMVQLNANPAAGMGGGIVQAGGLAAPGAPPNIMQASGCCAPGGCGSPISPPGLPGCPATPGMEGPPGAVAGVGAITGHVAGRFPSQRTSVRFVGPAGMKVSWYAPNSNGKPGFDTNQLEAPGRYNFLQAAIYRLKLSNFPNRPGLELYPTLEVVPANMKTESFLAHSSVPIAFTDEDFEQIAAGNFLVKVIYLPDPQFQDLASTGPDEVVSSRLEPGADPIAEARRRGSILLVVRLGNIDLEAPNTPSMDSPNPYMFRGAPHPMPGPKGSSLPPAPQGPYGVMGPSNPLSRGQLPTQPGYEMPAGALNPDGRAGAQTAKLPDSDYPSIRNTNSSNVVQASASVDNSTSSDARPIKKRHFWWFGSNGNDK